MLNRGRPCGLFCCCEASMRYLSVARKNYWIHLTEGALYNSTNVLLSAQTVFPALVSQLGGDTVAVGCIPIIVYLAFYLPQVLSANYIRAVPLRRTWTLKLGLLQRLQILLYSVVVAVFGLSCPNVALVGFFLIYVASQALAGLGSPVWFDLVVKTTVPSDRGKLMGLRTSLGGLLGLFNGFLLTASLSYLDFPYNYSAVFGAAFLLQFGSLLVLRNVEELHASEVSSHVSLNTLVSRIRSIIRQDRTYQKFLLSVALSTIGLMPVGFFLIVAMRTFGLPDSYVGLFTITMMAAQILGGAFLGWLADKRGHKASLLICALATLCATFLSLVGTSAGFYFGVFFFVGLNLGAEMITRYNFVERLAPVTERPLYIGIMNAWLAPFYCSAIVGGWFIDRFGYTLVFMVGLATTVAGMAMLFHLQDPSKTKNPVST